MAEIEEGVVLQELKDLKKVHPQQYADKVIQEDDDGEEEGEDEVSSESVDSSDEEIDMDAPLAVNKPIDRLNLKT